MQIQPLECFLGCPGQLQFMPANELAEELAGRRGTIVGMGELDGQLRAIVCLAVPLEFVALDEPAPAVLLKLMRGPLDGLLLLVGPDEMVPDKVNALELYGQRYLGTGAWGSRQAVYALYDRGKL